MSSTQSLVDRLLAELELLPSAAWRTGRKVGRTLYDGDTLIGVLDSNEQAKEAVLCRTAGPVLAKEVRRLRALLVEDDPRQDPWDAAHQALNAAWDSLPDLADGIDPCPTLSGQIAAARMRIVQRQPTAALGHLLRAQQAAREADVWYEPPGTEDRRGMDNTTPLAHALIGAEQAFRPLLPAGAHRSTR